MKILLNIAVYLLISGCSETTFLVNSAKRIGSWGDDPIYKVGNPYKINGKWYYPAVDYQYDEVGIASWYGPGFHGKSTANGEVFDQNKITAAHRTLPMPSIVKVTNLENGMVLDKSKTASLKSILACVLGVINPVLRAEFKRFSSAAGILSSS